MQEAIVSRRTIIGGATALAVPSIARGSGTVAHTVLGRSDGVWLNAPRRWNVDARGEVTLVLHTGFRSFPWFRHSCRVHGAAAHSRGVSTAL